MSNGQLSTPDHDLLLRLDTKMDGLTQSFQDFHTSLVTRVLKVENRLDNIDIYHAAIPLKDYDEAYKWVQKFRANLWLIGIVVGTLFGAIGGAVYNYVSKMLGLLK